MNRRNFIRGTAGLAALAVSGPTLAALSQTDRDRVEAQLASGMMIENQTFMMPDGRGITLMDLTNVTIRNCQFIWKEKVEGAYLELQNCTRCSIEDCQFIGPGSDMAFRIS